MNERSFEQDVDNSHQNLKLSVFRANSEIHVQGRVHLAFEETSAISFVPRANETLFARLRHIGL